MEASAYELLPQAIRLQLDALLADAGKAGDQAARDNLASIWSEKFKLFTAQISALGMREIDQLGPEDPRGAILLTYSGSLISLGPRRGKDRWLEYASIKLRADVPELVRGDKINLSAPALRDQAAVFEGSPLKRSSALYRIAVCPEGISPDEQERRVREATVYLTNGFIKLNKTLSLSGAEDVDQFTSKAIINYVAKKNGVTQILARGLIDDYLSMIETGILLGERVSVGKLGSASLRFQAARKARLVKNLKTGEDLLVPAKPAMMAPRFKFSQALKDKCTSLDPTYLGQDDEGDDDDD
ncbi:MAG: HU family DNA-binding protein [Spirochaetales bacterium]|nr:HU family DNA-binding protein [Spirochaetales bacterium]MBP7264582.1 HU family DNA-binding protein [Spirochaetia bacterium]